MDICNIGRDSGEEAAAISGGLSLPGQSAGHTEFCSDQAAQPPVGHWEQLAPSSGLAEQGRTQRSHHGVQGHLPTCFLTIRCTRRSRGVCKIEKGVMAAPTSRLCMYVCAYVPGKDLYRISSARLFINL